MKRKKLLLWLKMKIIKPRKTIKHNVMCKSVKSETKIIIIVGDICTKYFQTLVWNGWHHVWTLWPIEMIAPNMHERLCQIYHRKITWLFLDIQMIFFAKNFYPALEKSVTQILPISYKTNLIINIVPRRANTV